MKILLILALLAAPLGAQFRAGVARVKITPTLPAWFSGFAARTRPAETIAQDLWAKALAIEDAKGNRVVLVTADLIGFTREVTDEIAARAWPSTSWSEDKSYLTRHTLTRDRRSGRGCTWLAHPAWKSLPR